MQNSTPTAHEIDIFLHIYFQELQEELNKQQAFLSSLTYHKDEANIDSDLKEFLKFFIQTKFNRIPASAANKILIILHEQLQKDEEVSYNTFEHTYISNVFLPKETREQFQLKAPTPDLYLEISHKNKKYYRNLELKSTKGNNIPGSSIQQIEPNEWVIFVRHTTTATEVTIGKYIHALTNVLRFPDRSPRPEVAFETLKSWNEKNKLMDNNITLINYTDTEDIEKENMLENWQEHLTDKWLDIITAEPSEEDNKANEPWFNSTIKLFTLKYLKFLREQNESLELEEFRLKNLI